MKLFGTDGIRARAGEFPLNAAAIPAIGQAIGEELRGALLLGEDTRLSSPWIGDLLTKGIEESAAGPIQNAGVVPTPAVALLTRTFSFAGGIMISASHNPYEDNGIKIFSNNGAKLTDAAEARIEKRIFELLPEGAEARKDPVGLVNDGVKHDAAWAERYQGLLLSDFPATEWLRGRRVVIDCANGAMSTIAPSVLKKLGAEVLVICAGPDGKNINANCGAVHMGMLSTAMKDSDADFGVAFDGDGDRSLFVASSGKLIDGDAVLLVMARKLRPAIVVGTAMTNYAFEKMLQAEGIQLKRVAVGDRYVFEEMQNSGATLGGEPSGHIIFSDFRLSGDGLLTTLKLAQVLVESGSTLDELTRDWIPAPQLLKGVRVSQRTPLEEMAALQTTMRKANAELNGCGRLVVRYSGTEPLLRVMIESDSAARNDIWMEKLIAAIEDDFKNRG